MVIAMLALAVGQTLYTDHGDPTAGEQRVLWTLNRARSDPFAEGARLGINPDITENLTSEEAARTFPQPPLAMNAKLRQGALAYAQLMWDSNQFAHTVGGTTPPGRMTTAGYANLFNWAENLATGTGHTAEMLEDSLMIDSGVATRGHRTNMLDIYTLDPGPPPQPDPGPRREVGIGYLDAGADQTSIFRYILVQDFAASTANTPFLVGTVYLDANGNNEYDIGEGLGGVDVTVAGGSFHALTSSAGGYAFPCPASGTRDVTFAGTSLPATVVFSRAFSSGNLLVDLRVPPGDSDVDGLPDYWETRFGPLAPGVDTDGDTFSNMQEFRGGSDPLLQASIPAPPVVVTPPPSGGGGSSGGGGGCGATGVEGLAAAVLASLLFRAGRRV